MTGVRIRSEADLMAALHALAARDGRLAAARAAVPSVPLRILPAGLDGLLRIVAGQQLSTHAASAVWNRFQAAFAPLTPGRILAADDAALRAVGLSRQKIRTFRAVAAAVADGLALDALAEAPADEARATLEAIPGVGRWTADLYLMFCAGHPDIFPLGDLAVRKATGALCAVADTDHTALAAEAANWAPYRSAAARLMWAYYRTGGAARTPL